MTLLLLIVGVSAYDVGQASAAELSLFDAAPEVAVVPHAGVTTEPAQWRAVFCDAPPWEIRALEPETNEDPAGPDAPGVVRLVFGCTATVRSADQKLQAATVTYRATVSASSVLARAPPVLVRAPKCALRRGAR